MQNPYKVVKYDDGKYGVQYKDYPGVGLPESWGTMQHALQYMAALMGMTYEEYKELSR